MRLLAEQRCQVMFAYRIKVFRRLHRAIRSRRLNANNRPLRTEVTRQHAKLPGETRRRMEAKQRWAMTFTQRQQRLESQTLRLFIIIALQQCTQLFNSRSHHYLPRRYLTLKNPAQLRCQLHRQQRMSAKRKEVSLYVINLAIQQSRKRLRDGGFSPCSRRTS